MQKKAESSFNKAKRHVKKIKNIKWLLPGWVFYEYYKVHKDKGNSNGKSIVKGAEAEAIRLVAFASIPLPGSYELTTTGLALLKKKIEQGKVDDLTLKAFKDFTPLKKITIDKNKITGSPYLKIIPKGKKLYFRIFYKK